MRSGLDGSGAHLASTESGDGSDSGGSGMRSGAGVDAIAARAARVREDGRGGPERRTSLTISTTSRSSSAVSPPLAPISGPLGGGGWLTRPSS